MILQNASVLDLGVLENLRDRFQLHTSLPFLRICDGYQHTTRPPSLRAVGCLQAHPVAILRNTTFQLPVEASLYSSGSTVGTGRDLGRVGPGRTVMDVYRSPPRPVTSLPSLRQALAFGGMEFQPCDTESGRLISRILGPKHGDRVTKLHLPDMGRHLPFRVDLAQHVYIRHASRHLNCMFT